MQVIEAEIYSFQFTIYNLGFGFWILGFVISFKLTCCEIYSVLPGIFCNSPRLILSFTGDILTFTRINFEEYLSVIPLPGK